MNRWIRQLSPEEREKIIREKIDENKLGRETALQILDAFGDDKRRKIRSFERIYGNDKVARFKNWEQIDAAEKQTLIEVIGKKRSELEAYTGIPHMNRRTSADFCAFPAFWQDRRVARTASATWTARNGG